MTITPKCNMIDPPLAVHPFLAEYLRHFYWFSTQLYGRLALNSQHKMARVLETIKIIQPTYHNVILKNR